MREQDRRRAIREAREEAIAAGEPKFWPGVPCLHGHVCEWYTQPTSTWVGGKCCECAAEYNAKPEAKAKQRERNAKPEVKTKKRECKAKYYAKRKAEHPGYGTAGRAYDKAKRRGALPPGCWTRQELIAATLPLYDESTRLTKKTGVKHHVDHKTALNQGGLHHPDNLQILPGKANMLKSDSDEVDFLACHSVEALEAALEIARRRHDR